MNLCLFVQVELVGGYKHYLVAIRQATKLALLLRARADFSLFLENFKRGRVSARARVIDLHYSLSYVHVCAILSKDPSSGG